MLLATATSFKAGTVPVKACYVGDTKIWPSSQFSPATLPGLVTWLDAADYTPGSWRNRGSGPAVTVEGPTPMTLGTPVNGRPVVRFTKNEGRLRSTWPYPAFDWTVIYLVRFVGPNAGRAFSVQYPPSNLLIGMHSSGADLAYFNGTFIYGPGGWDSTWRLYGGDSMSGGVDRFFIDGTLIGGVAESTTYGMTGGWGISGYEASSTETMDIEVAELVLYDRRLTDPERVQVEEYLRAKWFGPTAPLYDPATQRYLDATGLNASYAPALDGLVAGLKATGLWAKMAAVYPFIGGTADLHKWNLMFPDDSDGAFRLGFWDRGTTSHSDALGYRANAQGQGRGGGYADTYLIPQAVLDVNSTHLAFYGLEDTPAEDRAEMGNFAYNGGGARFHIIARYGLGTNAFYYGQSEAGATSVGVPAASGLFVATRTGPANQSAYRNGVLLASDGSAPSAGLPPVSVLVGAISGFANATDIPCGFASIGSGLAAQDVADLNRVVTDYQTALNRRPVQTGFW